MSLLETPEDKCTGLGGIKAIYWIKASDMVFKDGEMRMKRKYGKFERKIMVQKYQPSNNP